MSPVQLDHATFAVYVHDDVIIPPNEAVLVETGASIRYDESYFKAVAVLTPPQGTRGVDKIFPYPSEELCDYWIFNSTQETIEINRNFNIAKVIVIEKSVLDGTDCEEPSEADEPSEAEETDYREPDSTTPDPPKSILKNNGAR